jgi:PAS domain S-box-containing protein
MSPETPSANDPSNTTSPPMRREPQARLIVQLAFDFLIAPPMRFDAEVDKSLRTVGSFVGADRSYLFLHSSDGRTISNTHEWCAEGIEPQIALLQELPVDTFPFLMKRLERQGLVEALVRDLPDSAQVEREVLQMQGIQSVILVRVLDAHDRMVGFVGFDAVRNERPWTDADIYLLEALGAILSSAIERRRTGRELAQAEEVYRALTESSPDGVYRMDPSGATVYANGRMGEIAGRPLQELVGHGWSELIHPEDHARVLADSHRALMGAKGFRSEYRLLRGDGRVVWVLDQARPISRDDTAGGGYIGTLTDISALKEAQAELARSETRSRALLEAMPDLMLRIARDGTYLDCSQAGRGLLLVDPSTFLGRKVEQMHPPETASFWMRSIRKALDEGSREVFEYELPIEGRFRDFEARLVRSGQNEVIAIIRDITERATLLREIRNNEAELRAVHSAIPDLIFVIGSQGVIHAFSAQRREELFIPPQFVSGANIRKVLPEPLATTVVDAIGRCLASGAIETLEYELPFPDGAQHFEARLAPMTEDRVVAVVRNISERKRQESELIAHRQRLRRLANELTVSEERNRRELALQLHDSIGQELAIARLRLQRAQETQGQESQENLAQASRLIEASIRNVQSLTFDMSPPALHELGLPHALRSYGRYLAKTHGVAVEYEESGEPAPLSGDQKILLFRCARELMVNVVKHAEATQIILSLDYEPDKVTVRVEDDGLGFDAVEALSRAPSEGAHFGLFSIRERLAAYGGSLDIRSGEGTVATVFIPLDPPAKA